MSGRASRQYLTPTHRERVVRDLRSLPFAIGIPGGGPGAIRAVDDLVDYLSRYTRHAAARAEEILEENRQNRRAANVLRSLRIDLENVSDTLRELDEADSEDPGPAPPTSREREIYDELATAGRVEE